MAKPKFDPEWDITYLLDKNNYEYHVIKNPEPIPGTGDYDQLFVKEGITVFADGRWYYWRLREPTEYQEWKVMNGLVDLNDEDEDGEFSPDNIFEKRINKGKGTIGHPAPRFLGRSDNNWIGEDPRVVPNNIDSDILGDLTLGHLMLSEHLQEGVEDPALAKKAK